MGSLGSVRHAAAAGIAVAALAACGGSALLRGAQSSMPDSTAAAVQGSPIAHVVVIVQENRSVDDLFHGLPGADTANAGKNSIGGTTKLRPISLSAPYDLYHSHNAFQVEYAGGKMNGFDLDVSVCSSPKPRRCPKAGVRAYGYVPHREVAPYFELAERYAFADRMFQTNQGPSFPAHQYLISGTSTESNDSPLRAAENPNNLLAGGCNSPKGTFVPLIDPTGHESHLAYPCFDRTALTDLIDATSHTWRYYQATLGPGLWNAPAAVLHTYESPEFAVDVIAPPSQFLSDVASGTLADVTWITPTALASDHAGITDGSGPSWVASVVNAIGESPYWSSTAIFLLWDDWGGWYDHVAPSQYNAYELGFRVPLLVISPYAKSGYVSHVPHEFGSILKFTEETLALGSLRTTDVRADDLSDCFDFSLPPRAYVPVVSALGPSYFLAPPKSNGIPDDDR